MFSWKCLHHNLDVFLQKIRNFWVWRNNNFSWKFFFENGFFLVKGCLTTLVRGKKASGLRSSCLTSSADLELGRLHEFCLRWTIPNALKRVDYWKRQKWTTKPLYAPNNARLWILWSFRRYSRVPLRARYIRLSWQWLVRISRFWLIEVLTLDSETLKKNNCERFPTVAPLLPVL